LGNTISILRCLEKRWNVMFTSRDFLRGWPVVAVIAWYLNWQLPMQSVPITTKVVSSNPAHGKMYLMQNYVIKFVKDLGRSIVLFHFLPMLISSEIWNLKKKLMLYILNICCCCFFVIFFNSMFAIEIKNRLHVSKCIKPQRKITT
jgi:hypothetical protein